MRTSIVDQLDAPVSAGGNLVDNGPLDRDIRLLQWQLGSVLRDHGSADLLWLAKRMRWLAHGRRLGEAPAAEELEARLSELDLDRLHQLVRLQACHLELVNLAEDRHRLRVLREREDLSYPAPRGESIGAAIDLLSTQGWTPDRIQDLLDQLEICPVFTAHPTEAKRVTVRRALAQMRSDLGELDRPDLLRRERAETLARIRADLMCFWETETVRPARPTVLDEVARNLFVANTLWDIAPRLYRDLRGALARNFPSHSFRIPRFIRFGTWIGGDRDGNPYVTAGVTRQTIELLRCDAIGRHLQACRELQRQLSLSERYHPEGTAITEAVQASCRRWPAVAAAIFVCHPRESYRQWLVTIRHRLEATAAAIGSTEPNDMAYSSVDELIADVTLIATTLRESGHSAVADGPVQQWLDRIAVIGFHTAELDIREESTRLRSTVQELASQARLCRDFAELSESAKQTFLLAEVPIEAARRLDPGSLTPPARETLELFQLLARVAARFGSDALGALIVSMTHHPSDVLAMLWLSRIGALREGVPHWHPSIMPLLETIADLQNADGILRAMLEQPDYRAHLERLGNNQICMIGYSDSVKDGGYLAANWQLYDAQSRLAALADEFGITITCFHGRGGALGRGGGPMARAVLSLPPNSVHGKMRVTEQGEVVAERYGDPRIAHRHLEQLTWATILVSADIDPRPQTDWAQRISRAAEAGYVAYRRLIEDPAFPAYFRRATPIDVIESLSIGSRPSRRGDRSRLEHLRAIPYTFAWTQNRHLLTGYFGLGSGLWSFAGDDWSALSRIYQEWPFFRALVDNAELALAKAEPKIMCMYAALASGTDAERIAGLIEAEFESTRTAILRVKQQTDLLDGKRWLKQSIALRNPDVDLLNFIQLELLRRKNRLSDEQTGGAEVDLLDELLRASVHAISVGMRSTG